MNALTPKPTAEQHGQATVLNTSHELMRDAAFAGNVPKPWDRAVAGYLNDKGDPYHPWTELDWKTFPGNRKLPIFVQSHPDLAQAEREAFDVLQSLFELGVPVGSRTALDLETAVHPTYVRRYGRVLQYFGYRVWVYGSASTVFRNPALNGYWVADYLADEQPFMFDHPQVRATQYTDHVKSGGKFDSSTVKEWVYADKKHWWV